MKWMEAAPVKIAMLQPIPAVTANAHCFLKQTPAAILGNTNLHPQFRKFNKCKQFPFSS
jgi:hypothetical protein